jgi:hypothetical protein
VGRVRLGGWRGGQQRIDAIVAVGQGGRMAGWQGGRMKRGMGGHGIGTSAERGRSRGGKDILADRALTQARGG